MALLEPEPESQTTITIRVPESVMILYKNLTQKLQVKPDRFNKALVANLRAFFTKVTEELTESERTGLNGSSKSLSN